MKKRSHGNTSAGLVSEEQVGQSISSSSMNHCFGDGDRKRSLAESLPVSSSSSSLSGCGSAEGERRKKMKQADKEDKIDDNSIPGLLYVESFVTIEEEKQLLKEIDKREWLSDLKRRVQHYGYKYSYKEGSIDKERDRVGDGCLPEFLSFLVQRLLDQNYLHERPDQVIVNEYEPGQGISVRKMISFILNLTRVCLTTYLCRLTLTNRSCLDLRL